MNTPILFLLFNRPDKAKIVFERIKEAQPNKLFIAADGPRSGKEGEANLCEKTRKVVLDAIDWPCEVHTLLRNKNLGCKLAVSSAIDWFFKHVEEGIILEDDCLPDPSFFQFCSTLLERYRDDEKVMMISGCNLHSEKNPESSYYFSRYGHIWGWATWRKAWQHYDITMKNWSEYKASGRMEAFLSKSALKKRTAIFNGCLSENISTWDMQWTFTRWNQNGISVVPSTNLILNIGSVGIHMKPYDPCLSVQLTSLPFPLSHPENKNINTESDHRHEQSIGRNPFQVLALIFKYLIRCCRQKKNILQEIRLIALCLYEEVKSRIKYFL